MWKKILLVLMNLCVFLFVDKIKTCTSFFSQDEE